MRAVIVLGCAAVLMGAVGCGSKSDAPTTATNTGMQDTGNKKEKVQQLKMQANPNYVPPAQGSKLSGN